jgi:hypothetical protein
MEQVVVHPPPDKTLSYSAYLCYSSSVVLNSCNVYRFFYSVLLSDVQFTVFYVKFNLSFKLKTVKSAHNKTLKGFEPFSVSRRFPFNTGIYF